MRSDNNPSCRTKIFQMLFWGWLKLVSAIKSLVLIVFLIFFSLIAMLYFFDVYNNKTADFADILGTVATLMIAGAVLSLQFFNYKNDIEKRREKEARGVLLNLSELFFENIENDFWGNKYDANFGEEVPYPYTKERYLIFWKFEYIDSMDKGILEVGCRRLYCNTGRHYYGSTMIFSIEIISTDYFVKSYRNDKNLDVLKENGRKNVKFSDFTNKEWDTAMEIMPRKLFESFASFVPGNIAP